MKVKTIIFAVVMIFVSNCIIMAASSDNKTGILPGGRIDGAAFEICVNNQIIRSDSPLLKSSGAEKVQDRDGVLTTTYRFKGKRQLRGLNVYVDRQTFEGSGLVRERMRLKSDIDGKFRLTNFNDANHLVFPIHSFKLPSGICKTDEIKIGTFVQRHKQGNHSFFPTRNSYQVLDGQHLELKGPVTHISSDCGHDILWTYEHASQDEKVLQKIREKVVADAAVDAFQGVTGNMMEISEDDLWFIATGISIQGSEMKVCNKIRHGGYLDGEFIPSECCYETVWSAVTEIPEEQNFEEALNDYLFDKISYNRRAGKHQFYYNTWGMQRDYPGNMLYSVYTYDNLLKEIDYASEMGLDLFVFDDGWEQAMGQWTPNEGRLPDGLDPLIKALVSKGMEPGIWISPLATKDTSAIFKEHPEWIIKDLNGNPVLGQWNCPVVDLGSPYYDMLLSSLKNLVDQGIKFFKFDGIDTFNSYQDGFRGIGGNGSVKEKIDRYNYQFPFYITGLMRALREYDQDVVVELDLTELERCMIGLMPLQEGKFYYINNGRSGYKDYSEKNADTKREALTGIAGVFPPESITLSSYANNSKNSLKYALHTVLISGHGLWGRLDSTTPAERAWIHNTLDMAKRVLAHTSGSPLEADGGMADDVQTLVQKNREDGFAIVTSFSKKPGIHNARIQVCSPAGVIGCPFIYESGSVNISLSFDTDNHSSAAFVIGAEGNDKRVLSSSGILKDISYENGQLVVTALTDTEITVAGKNEAIAIPAGVTVRL